MSSTKTDDEKRSLHRRGSSLTNLSEATSAVAEMKKKGHTRNRSSPDIDYEAVTKSSADPTQTPKGDNDSKQPTEQEEADKKRAVEMEVSGKIGVGSQSELSRSTGSAISAATLSVDDDADTVIDEGEQKQEVQKEEVPRIDEEWDKRKSKDRSVSTSTIQNEKTDGELEVSLEHKNQMSVAFRQELLSISQLKTDSRIGMEVAKLSDPGLDLVQLLGRCLPYIVPNVVLAKREVRNGEVVREGDLQVLNVSPLKHIQILQKPPLTYPHNNATHTHTHLNT